MLNSMPTDSSSVEHERTAYREYLAEREAILQHKWFLSESAGCDIGFEAALLDWAQHQHAAWRKARSKMPREAIPD
jgi:Domain of unknown function (DUF4032)